MVYKVQADPLLLFSGTVAMYKTQLFEQVYPGIYKRLKQICSFLDELKSVEDTAGLISAIHHLSTSFDEYCCKEKLVLFPFLEQLENTNSKAPSCKPFKNIRAHYTAIMNMAASMKQMRSDVQDEHHATRLMEMISAFENAFTQVHRSKDEQLYARFSNCSRRCTLL